MPRSVFISYARNDQQAVESLRSDLESLGYSVWYDDQITGGSEWWEHILNNIRKADIVIIAISSSSLDSVACQREYKYARALTKPLLPVRMNAQVVPSALPVDLQCLQMVNYIHAGKPEMGNLALALRNLPSASALPDPPPEPPAIPLSYAAVLREQLLNQETLNEEKQAHLLFRIKGALHNQDKGEAIELLGIFKKRRDLLAVTAREVGELLKQLSDSDPKPPPNWRWGAIVTAGCMLLAATFFVMGNEMPPEEVPPSAQEAPPPAGDESQPVPLAHEDQPPASIFPLTIHAAPKQANIRIMNIRKRYKPGIMLPAGDYDIEVSAADYISRRQWVALSPTEYFFEIGLEPVPKKVSKPENLQPGEERMFDGIPFVWIPKGYNILGSEKGELPYYLERNNEYTFFVSFREGFWMGKYEVTFAEYDLFCTATARKMPDDEGWGREQRPVINVSWSDASAYANWMSQQSGLHFDLPTEKEWEYAVRAGKKTVFSTGNCINSDEENYKGEYPYMECPKGESRRRTLPVGSLVMNDWGLYDMHGNVREWTSSLYRGHIGLEPKKNEEDRMIRGGSWDVSAYRLRSAHRGSSSPTRRSDDVGFRLILRQDN